MGLLKALFGIVVVWTVFVIIPELVLAWLKKSTDKEIDDFCRRERERNGEHGNGGMD